MPKSKKNKVKPVVNVAQLTTASEPKVWLLLTILVIILFIVFSPSLTAYYLNLDDPLFLLDNKLLKNFSTRWDWKAVSDIFTTDSSGSGTFVPFVIISYAIEIYFFAPDPRTSSFIFHLDNMLLHIGCAVLIFFIFRKMNINKWGSFIGALLWGIHPMKVESVVWVSERKDVLYGFFFLLTLLTYIQYIKLDKHKARWYILAILFSLLSYLSKLQAVTFPLCMIALDFYFRRENWYKPKQLLLEKLPWWLFSISGGLLGVYYTHIYKVTGTSEAVIAYGFIEKFALACYTYVVYMMKFIYPCQMTYYSFPQQVPWLAYVCLLIIPLSLAAFIWAARKNIFVLTGLILFTVNVMLMLNIPFIGSGYMPDRFTYIAYIGLVLIVVQAYQQWKFKNKNILLVPYLLLLFVTTYQQGSVWKNTVSFWENKINKNKDSYFGYYALGIYYEVVMQGRWQQDPFIDFTDAGLKQLPLQYMETAKLKDSINGMPDKKTTAQILNGCGVAYGLLGMYNEGIPDFTKSITLAPQLKESYLSRGVCYYVQKKYELALKDYEQYAKLDSTDASSYYFRSLCERDMSKFSEGLSSINKAISLDNMNAEYYSVKATLFHSLNMIDSMHSSAQKARGMGAEVPQMLLQ